MPMYARKRGYGGRSYYKKRKGNIFYRRASNKGVRLARKALSMLNVEYKFHDVQLNTSVITDAPIITQLSNIGQGDTQSTRDGAQVKAVRLNIKYILKGHVSATRTQVRIMIVHDKQTNQAIYTAANLLEDSSIVDNFTSMLNLDNKYRFRVLYDKVHVLNSSGGNRSIFKSISKHLSLKLRYDAAAGDITDLTSSSLSIVMFANEPTNTPTVTMFSRLRFIDN